MTRSLLRFANFLQNRKSHADNESILLKYEAQLSLIDDKKLALLDAADVTLQRISEVQDMAILEVSKVAKVAEDLQRYREQTDEEYKQRKKQAKRHARQIFKQDLREWCGLESKLFNVPRISVVDNHIDIRNTDVVISESMKKAAEQALP